MTGRFHSLYCLELLYQENKKLLNKRDQVDLDGRDNLLVGLLNI